MAGETEAAGGVTMRLRALLVAAAIVAALGVSFPARATSGTYTWTASIGSGGVYGAVGFTGSSTGAGTARVTLKHLAASTKYGIEIWAGTCSRRGDWLFAVSPRRSSTSGTVSVTQAISASSMDRIRRATWGAGRMSVRVGHDTWVACGTFVDPPTPWPTPTPTPTFTVAPTPTPTPTPMHTMAPTATPSPTSFSPISPGTIDWDLSHCPSAADIASVRADLKITFQADPTAGSLVCTASAGSADLTRFQERAYQAILSMRRIHFDAPLPWTSKPLYDWFVDAVDGVNFLDNGLTSGCCYPPRIVNIQATPDSTVLVSNRWIAPSLSAAGGLMYLVQLLVHEARHSEGFGHACGTGDDQTIAEMGAWGVVYSFYRWLALHGDPAYLAPPADAPALHGYKPADYYRQVELSEAQTTRSTRFCSEPH